MYIFFICDTIPEIGAMHYWTPCAIGLCSVYVLNVIGWRGVEPRTQWRCIITPANCLQLRHHMLKDLPQRLRRLQWRHRPRHQVRCPVRIVITVNIAVIFSSSSCCKVSSAHNNSISNSISSSSLLFTITATISKNIRSAQLRIIFPWLDRCSCCNVTKPGNYLHVTVQLS